MIRSVFAAVCIALCVGSASGVGASPAADQLTVDVQPTNESVVLGESFDITVTVTNSSDEPAAVVVHLDITDPAGTMSVDPEDWTPELNQAIGVLQPGQSSSVGWSLQPIAPGEFSVYAVAFRSVGSDLATSPILTVEVADQRTLNPGGILPVAFGMPALIGALLLARSVGTRRSASRVVT